MKHLITFFSILLWSLTSSAQTAVGSWQQYRAYGNATDQIIADGQVFCLASGNLFAYDIATTELQTFDTSCGLGSNGIKFIEHDAKTHTLVIVYADGVIDLMDTRSCNVTSLTSLRDASIQSKTVNGIFTADKTAWLLMSFGLVELRLAERCFGETYDMGKNVVSGAVFGNSLYYCVSENGMFQADLSQNLHDTGVHTKINGSVYTKMLAHGEFIYACTATDFNILDPSNDMATVQSSKVSYRSMRECDKGVAVVTGKGFVIGFDDVISSVTACPDLCSITSHSGSYWASCGLKGLIQFKQAENGTLQQAGGAIIPNSPRYDYFYRMDFVDDRLLVAGGAHEYTANADFDGTASYYENGTWVNLDTVVIGSEKFQNLTGITQHPDDKPLHYVTSMGHGVYVYRDGHFEQRYNCDNTPLMSIRPQSSHYYNYVRTNAPTFDSGGNLWVLNCEVDTVIWRLSADGKTWKGFYFSELKEARSPIAIHIDANNRLWMLSRDMGTRGLFCYDQKTKKHRLSGKILQQDGLEYAPDNYLCMTPDKNGHLWIGTEQGLFVIDKPDEFFDNNFEWTQIKVNREDGSGLADYLLSGAYVSAIAVDGGNRKWIGTLGSGVYLLSHDGQKTIHHFTTDNSPLPSDDIRSIAINPGTGEVMIGTINGLVSYMSDATEPEETLDKGNIEIYPNPVQPEYDGDVIIRGLAADCEVKIASVGGQVIWSGTSVGGTMTWNLQRKGGGRVSSGIYNVIINTADASDVVVGRLAIIR